MENCRRFLSKRIIRNNKGDRINNSLSLFSYLILANKEILFQKHVGQNNHSSILLITL